MRGEKRDASALLSFHFAIIALVFPQCQAAISVQQNVAQLLDYNSNPVRV